MNIIFEFVNKKNKLIKKNILQKGRLYKILKYKNCGFTKKIILWSNISGKSKPYSTIFGPVRKGASRGYLIEKMRLENGKKNNKIICCYWLNISNCIILCCVNIYIIHVTQYLYNHSVLKPVSYENLLTEMNKPSPKLMIEICTAFKCRNTKVNNTKPNY